MANKDAFTRSYVGKGIPGADEYGYTIVWNATSNFLKPSSYITIHNKNYCLYCGKEMKVIQMNGDYKIIGYCCTCEKAEKEISTYEKIKNIKGKCFEKCEILKEKLPKVNISKIKKNLLNSINNKKNSFDLWDLDIKIKNPYEE